MTNYGQSEGDRLHTLNVNTTTHQPPTNCKPGGSLQHWSVIPYQAVDFCFYKFRPLVLLNGTQIAWWRSSFCPVIFFSCPTLKPSLNFSCPTLGRSGGALVPVQIERHIIFLRISRIPLWFNQLHRLLLQLTRIRGTSLEVHRKFYLWCKIFVKEILLSCGLEIVLGNSLVQLSRFCKFCGRTQKSFYR